MTSFNASLYQTLGLTLFSAKAPFKSKKMALEVEKAEVSPQSKPKVKLKITEAVSQSVNELAKVQDKEPSPEAFEKKILCLGAFLPDQVGSSQQESKLWANIMGVFQWPEEQILLIDTQRYQQDQVCFDLLDQLMSLDILAVLSFEKHSLLLEILADGFDVCVLPTLNEMLDSPSEKKTTFLTLSNYVQHASP